MILRIKKETTPQLLESDNFRELKVVVDSGLSVSAHAEHLQAIGTLDPDGSHFWIHQIALRELAGADQTQEWSEAFDHMIDTASRYGWVDPEAQSVRAHIEFGKS